MKKSSSKSSANRNPRRRRRILSENTPGEDAQIQKEKYIRRLQKITDSSDIDVIDDISAVEVIVETETNQLIIRKKR
jgi:hypothetical protein